MSSAAARQRVDVWLYRARLVKTRAEAARLITEGSVRLVRGEVSRALDKASAELAPGDTLLVSQAGKLRSVQVKRLPPRRGPPAEARALYADVASED